MSRTAIVILNWNGKKLLERFLPAVVEFSPEAEVIVADNHSEDDSVEFMKNRFPAIRVIRLEKNYGFARGYNESLKYVESDYYLLLNSDVEVTRGWLRPLISFLDENPEVAACQPKIRSYTDRNRFEHAGAAGGYIDVLGYPFCRGRIISFLEEDHGQYDSVRKIFWATGACMLIRSSVFNKLGGFDERFFAHMEEIDLCWRIQRLGFSLYCIPQSVVYHVGGGTLPSKNPRKTYFNFRNNLMMLHNNLEPDRIFRILFIRLLMDGLAAMKFLLEGDFRDAWAVLRSHYHFHCKVLLTGGKRKHYAQMLPYVNPDTICKGSVVWNYFIRKKKKFSEQQFNPKP